MKFEILRQWREQKHLAPLIPPFWEVKADFPDQVFFEKERGRTFILRSKIPGEGEHKLCAGRGLSFKGLTSYSDYLFALAQIREVQKEQELILMEEVKYDYHGTLSWQQDRQYVELVAGKTLSTLSFTQNMIWGPREALEKECEALLAFFPLLAQEKIAPRLLIELGLKAGQLFIFQVTPMPLKITDPIVPVKTTSQWSARFQQEWRAYRLRQKKTLEQQDSAENWKSLWQYFGLFCQYQKREMAEGSWNDFILWAGQAKHFLARVACEHLRIHKELGLTQELAAPASFRDLTRQMWYLGQGEIRVRRQDCLICPELPAPRELLRLRPGTLVLTGERKQLSHSYLTVVEEGLPMVANIPGHHLHEWQKLKAQDWIEVNFSQKTLSLGELA